MQVQDRELPTPNLFNIFSADDAHTVMAKQHAHVHDACTHHSNSSVQ